ncbi:hypothetical protein FBUS_08691 [Fasciolopsis buskii]|uniref:Uncharacterized protein n=1 Tax=Fasciolopsis buskii TaxID=27845 RepID=A0A8E0VPW5_9TREM|nr:hypothetical protein FBUS_08691 [Fasciolopsis buski]
MFVHSAFVAFKSSAFLFSACFQIRKIYRPHVLHRLRGSSMPPSSRLSSTISSLDFVSREFFYPDYYHMKALNHALTFTHDLFQIPWGLTIVGTAFLIRTLITSPFYVYSERNLAKVLHISLDCARTKPLLLKKLESSVSYKRLDPLAAERYLKKMVIFWFSLLSTTFHSAMVIYWCTSSVHQLLTHLILMHPGARRQLSVWPRPHEGERPYSMLFLQIKSRYRLFRYLYRKRSG